MTTSKDKPYRISVHEYSAGTSMRHFADKLFDLIESMKVTKVEIDFSEVDFVSRSFVQQYFVRKANSTVETSEINCNEAVNRMLTLVQKNQRSEERFNFDTWKVANLTA